MLEGIMSEGKKDNFRIIAGSFFWTFNERFLAQLVTIIVTIALARILTPGDFGIISIVTVLIAICNVFVTNGIGSALVQKKEAKDIDYDSALYLNLLLSFFIYFCLFAISPLMEQIYNINDLSAIIRIMGIRVPLAAVNSVQQAYIRRKMEFKKFFWATFGGSIVSGGIGILLAINGAGAWAVVAQYLSNSFVDSCVLALSISWRPKLQFSVDSAKQTFSFGWKLLASELIATIGGNLRVLLVGQSFGTASLAYYDQGRRYPGLLTTNVNLAINQVMLPFFSRQQDSISKLRSILRKSVQVGTFLLAPLLLGFAAVSKGFLYVVLTDKWLPCAPFLQIFCIYFVTRPIEAICGEAIKALGKSGHVLLKMIIVNITAIIFLLISVFCLKSIMALALTMLANMAISVSINAIISYELIGYKILDQMRDILCSIIPAVLMGAVVYLFGEILKPSFYTLGIQIMVGVICYLFFSYIINRNVMDMTLKYFMSMKKRSGGE